VIIKTIRGWNLTVHIEFVDGLKANVAMVWLKILFYYILCIIIIVTSREY